MFRVVYKEVVIQKCSSKKVFLKICKIHWKTPVLELVADPQDYNYVINIRKEKTSESLIYDHLLFVSCVLLYTVLVRE